MATAAKSPPLIAPGILCPKCGGAMLDERMNKRSEKSPDYTCANMTCLDASGKYRTAIWVEKNGSTPTASRTPSAGETLNQVAAAGAGASEKPKMRDAYKSLTEWVLKEIAPLYDEYFAGEQFTPEVAAACTQTLFIQACKAGKVE